MIADAALAVGRLPLRVRENIRLFAIFCTLTFYAKTSSGGFGPGFESVSIARALVHTGNFADAYLLPTGLTAHCAPLYPAFLAALLWLGRSSYMWTFLALCVNLTCLLILSFAILPRLSARLFGERRIGQIAGWMLILLPATPMEPESENLLVAFSLACLCLLSLTDQKLRWASLGALGGCIVLLNPSTIPFLAVWLLGLTCLRRIALRETVAAALAIAAICLPWCLRNYFELGTLSIRDNFGLELRVYNNDLAGPSFKASAAAIVSLHPTNNWREAEKVKQLGEVEYNARELSLARDWVSSHQRRFFTLAIERYFLFWFPSWREGLFALATWLFTIVSVPGTIRALRGRRVSAAIILAMLAYSPIYALVGAELRYRIPVLWITVLFAAQAMWAPILRFTSSPDKYDRGIVRIDAVPSRQ